ncbi:MAG: UDP-N-acetylmuramoyl-tripeptide--D-alanyl-D-alanine ligase [Bacilli bacterium]|nr:UDP-N-acetylmuramoyl-tripeptide--D-alanyl-D-alanine ligase [Bacilli bacterium]
MIFFNIICLILIISELTYSGQTKLPLKYTSRVKRLVFTDSILHLIPIIIMSFIVKDSNMVFMYLTLGFIAFINSVYVLLAVYINMPVEKLVGLYYKVKAKNKLQSMNNLKVIGITGSYGKTSSKNILNDILNIKYNSLPTPKNFNTPFGLMITINNYLDKFTDVFIAEMGACQQHDIEELCDLVKPKYGIITKIGVAHLATFGSRENIQKTKFELIENLPEDGLGILNGDDEWQRSYKIKNSCKTKWIGINSEDVDVRATDISLSPEGTRFNVIFKGDDNKYPFETKLLGYNNVYNILSSIALGKEFGMTIEQLRAGVAKVKAVEHRLELKKQGDITIIDDAYNSNPTGSKMALDVLKMMPGKHIVVTPGMIELGEEEYEKNKEFGKFIADCADEVILVGQAQTKPIQDGLKEMNYDESHIHIINDVMRSFDMVKTLKDGETYVLLENDLPDIFNEK